MKLNKNSIEWAIIHNKIVKDTDLFPLPKEIEIFEQNLENSVQVFKNIDIDSYKWKSARRYLIPKKKLSYRMATQLNPLDSVLLSAIIYEYGDKIEQRRIPIDENKIFSYRFAPNKLGYMYTLEDSWKKFWEYSSLKAEESDYIVYVDISDFYNQIYHHTLENELIASGFPNSIKKSLVNLFTKLTAKVSRGIPVGPHSTHLLAEMVLISLDNYLKFQSKDFSRYADDIIVFCDSRKEAEKMIYEIAEFLDSNQRLVLSSGKTKIYKKKEFLDLCDAMTSDNPINDIEFEMIEVLNKYGANLYTAQQVINLSEEDASIFSEEKVSQCLEAYLSEEDINFDRIKWFYRRMSQIQMDTAMEFTLQNIDKLVPAISEIISYFISVGESKICTLDLTKYGDKIFELLNDDLVKSSGYLQLLLVSLFSGSNTYNHIDKLMRMFSHSGEDIKREILFACYNYSKSDELYGWIYGLKEQVGQFNDWTKSAYYITSTLMLAENKKFFLKHSEPSNELEEYIIKWAKKN